MISLRKNTHLYLDIIFMLNDIYEEEQKRFLHILLLISNVLNTKRLIRKTDDSAHKLAIVVIKFEFYRHPPNIIA